MAGNVSLNTVTDGLVMYLDAANTKSLADVPSRNLLLWSQQFDNWSKYQSTVSTDTTTAPDGTSTADTNIETSGLTGWRGVSQQLNGVTSGGTYTFSIYAKNYNGRNIQMTVYDVPLYANFYVANFNLQLGVIISSYDTGNGVLTNSSIVSVGNGWYRCSISGYIPNATQVQPYVMLVNSGNTTSYTGDGVSGVYLWGGQMEVGNVATTYIPTTTTAVSRIPVWSDVSKGGNNGTLTSGFTYNYSNGGSLVFDGGNNYYTNTSTALSITTNVTINVWAYHLSGATTNVGNYVAKGYNAGYRFRREGPSGQKLWLYSDGNTIKGGVIYDNLWYMITAVFSSGGLMAYVNGTLVASNTTPFSPSNVNNSPFYIGCGLPSTEVFKGYIQSTQVYNRALSASEVLQNYNSTKSRFGL